MIRCGIVLMVLTAFTAGAADVLPPDTETAANLIAQLGDDNFDMRESAQAKLERLGTSIIPQLMQTAVTSDDPEVVSRCRRAIATLEYEPLAGKARAFVALATKAISSGQLKEAERLYVSAR